MRLRRLVLVGALVSSSVPGWAQGTAVAQHPKVAAALEVARVWLDAVRDFQQIPGVSAAIVHDQDVLWIGGFGYADLARKAPAGPDTIYSICSISKKLRKTGEHTFRRVRKDEALGEEIVFEMGPDGRAARLEWHSNLYRRVR